jgi:hypothetical protein
MNRSEQIADLIAALAKAQAEFGVATKESDNPYYNSRYADLAAVINAVRPALSKNGIALMQFMEADLERQTASVTTALHHGEQWVSVTIEAPATGRTKKDERSENPTSATKFDVQTIGACSSYLRRYTLQAICGLASEDDDGEALARVDNKPIQRKTPAQVTPPPNAPPASATSHPVEEGNFDLRGDLLECVIKGVTDKTTKGGKAYCAVTLNGRIEGFNWVSNWHGSLTPALKDAIGKPCIIKISRKMSEDGKSVQFLNLEDVLYVDGVDYAEGKPVLKTEESHA